MRVLCVYRTLRACCLVVPQVAAIAELMCVHTSMATGINPDRIFWHLADPSFIRAMSGGPICHRMFALAGAELQHVCNEAAMHAARRRAAEVAHSDFAAALAAVSPALTAAELDRYRDWAKRYSR